MAKYIVKSPLNHDGKLYEMSKTIELTEEQAAPLLAVKAIEPPSAQTPEKKGKE